jgi:hypothetical protein
MQGLVEHGIRPDGIRLHQCGNGRACACIHGMTLKAESGADVSSALSCLNYGGSRPGMPAGIPGILENCHWFYSEFGLIMAINRNNRPILPVGTNPICKESS